MRPFRPLLLVLVLFSSTLAGCLESPDGQQDISLIVNYEQTNGTIVHSYVDGELQSATDVALSFDFSKTQTVNQLISYGVEVVQTEEIVMVDAPTESTVAVSYTHLTLPTKA